MFSSSADMDRKSTRPPAATTQDSLNRKYKDYVYRKMLVQEYLKK